MNRMAGVPLAVLLLLIAVCSPAVGRPLGGRGSSSGGQRSISGYSDDDFAGDARGSEVRDLLSAGNSPRKSVNDKKRMKNSAGKSDEGGFYKTFGSDAEGEKGYLRQTYSKGDHGYKTLDTFHKKDGDNYGFEEHTAFGKARGRDKSAGTAESGSHATKGNDAGDHEGAGTIVDTHYVAEGGDKADEGGEGAAESGETASYAEGDDGGHYGGSTDGDAGEYSEGDSDAGNYGNSDGYNEQYSSGGGDEGSYGSSSSYSHDGDGGGEYY